MAEQPKPKEAKALESAKALEPVKRRGVQAKRSSVAQIAPASVLAEVAKPVPTSQLVPSGQSFKGIPEAAKKEPKKANPLIQPGIVSLPQQPLAGQSLPKPSISRKKKPLAHAKATANYRPRHEVMDPDLDTLLEDSDPILKEYYEKQNEIQSANPYVTDTEIYIPQSRKGFYRFIQDNYQEFELQSQMKGDIDEDACAKLGASTGAAVEAFLYQKFIREYIRNAAPYRGVLVYHGLGSGKTCSAIAAAEAIYGTSNKKIIVMTPASLRGNFMSEVSFCGFRHFNVHNHWIYIPIEKDSIEYIYAYSILSLSETFLKRVLGREDARRGIWIPDFTQEENYNDLEQQERDDIREQLTQMIDSRITFISYNGISAAKLKEYACQKDAEGHRFFDNKVIVVDEIHNLTRLMQGNILPYIMKRKGRARKIPPEPIIPGKWEPTLCGREENYKRAYLFYRLLSDARNSKIIGLSGTPLINFPEELGILANLLAGYTECAELILRSVDKNVMDQCKEIVEAEPRVDILRFKTLNQQMSVLISVFNEGYERVMNDTDEFIGVRYNAEAQDGIREVYGRIKMKLQAAGLPIGEETYVSYPRLPIDDETFEQEFIDGDLTIKNKVVMQKRLTGLISYYRGSKEEYMPRVVKDEVVKCELSEYALPLYIKIRKGEIEGEIGKEKEPGDIFALVEVFAKMKNPSSYRFRSRAVCNFAFPTSIGRPFPNSKEVDEEVAPIKEDIAVSEQVGEEEITEKEQAELERLLAEEEEAAENVISEVNEGEVKEELEDQEDQEDQEDNLLKEFDLDQLAEMVENSKEDPEMMSILRDEYERRKLPFLNDPISNSNVSYLKELRTLDPADLSELLAEETDEKVQALMKFVIAEKSQKGGSEEDEIREMLREFTNAELIEGWEGNDGILRPLIEEIMKEKGVAVPGSDSAASPAVIENNAAIFEQIKDELRKLSREDLLSAWETSDDDMRPLIQEIMKEKGISIPKAVLPYKDRIIRAMKKLNEKRNIFMRLGKYPGESNRLGQFSTKLDAILRRIQASKGSNLVYSQFKTVEGMGVLGIALKANGYAEIRIDGTDLNPRFSDETILSFLENPQQKRFILFTGEGSRERRTLILNIFNGNFDKLPEEMREVLESQFAENRNTRGEICWVIGITGAGAEGISLKCCRAVHIMEPYWNNVRLDQVKGRAIRICSHKDLPFKERDVEIYTYYSVFSDDQKKTLDMTLRTTDNSETSDEKVFKVGLRKDKVNQELLTMMKESAVDCELNEADNDGVQCLVIDGKPDQYLFDPDLQVDKLLTSMELKEEKKKPVQSSVAFSSVAAPPPSAKKTSVPVMEWGQERYLLSPKDGSGGLIMNIYHFEDKKLRIPIGTIAVNPLTRDLRGSAPVFK
uniref:Helicase ATP-binding domain-containing protein n=1 Tax=viral metagenome TaxID=1070528 RepID=A0A6C0KQW7_9ZZZZ